MKEDVLYFVATDNLREVKRLIQEGADVNAPNDSIDKLGESPLHYAAAGGSTGRMEFVRLLLQSGANVNATDANGVTPLHRAVFPGHFTESVRCLLANGANINAKDRLGYTPLDYALRHNVHPIHGPQEPDVSMADILRAHGGRCRSQLPPEPALNSQPTMYDVVITGVKSDRKISAIAALRNMTGLALQDVKHLVDNMPSALKRTLPEAEAGTLAEKLRESGFLVDIRGR